MKRAAVRTVFMVAAGVVTAGVVTAAAPRGHYVLTQDVARDVRTELEWRRRPESPTPVSLGDALLACNNVPGGGWRVPTARELESLFDIRATTTPAWDGAAFGSSVSTPPVVWSLTPVRVGTSDEGYLVVDFRPDRQVASLAATSTALVRCVRSAR